MGWDWGTKAGTCMGQSTRLLSSIYKAFICFHDIRTIRTASPKPNDSKSCFGLLGMAVRGLGCSILGDERSAFCSSVLARNGI